MSEQRKVRSAVVDDAQIQAWADEAEAGYDVASLQRRGRPLSGEGPGVAVTVRLDAQTLAALIARAKPKG